MKQRRADYYSLLDRVRRDGDWEAWLAFFLDGVRVTAEGAVDTAQRLAAMFRDDRARIEPTGRRAGSALRVHEALKSRPILSVPAICERTGLSFPAAPSAIALLVETGMARELTGKRRKPAVRVRPLPRDPERGNRSTLSTARLDASLAHARPVG